MSSKIKWPELTKQPILHVDATPDDSYPLRILRAYRESCDCRWIASPEPNPLCDLMNEHCKQRAKILDKAIAILAEQGR